MMMALAMSFLKLLRVTGDTSSLVLVLCFETVQQFQVLQTCNQGPYGESHCLWGPEESRNTPQPAPLSALLEIYRISPQSWSVVTAVESYHLERNG